jgi:hypothetical protein
MYFILKQRAMDYKKTDRSIDWIIYYFILIILKNNAFHIIDNFNITIRTEAVVKTGYACLKQ